MNRLFGAAVGALMLGSLTAGAAGQSANDQAERAEAHAIIDIMLPPDSRDKMLDDMMSSLGSQMRQATKASAPTDPGARAIIDKYLDRVEAEQRPLLRKHQPALLAAMETAYVNEFTLAELKDIHSFARSPSGRHYLSRSLALVSDPAVVKVNTAMIAEAQQGFLAMRQELTAELLAYYEAHPDAVRKDK